MWEAHLNALLEGRTLDVYNILPVDDAADYEKLKDVLLKNFDVNFGLEKKYRYGKPEKSGTFI